MWQAIPRPLPETNLRLGAQAYPRVAEFAGTADSGATEPLPDY